MRDQSNEQFLSRILNDGSPSTEKGGRKSLRPSAVQQAKDLDLIRYEPQWPSFTLMFRPSLSQETESRKQETRSGKQACCNVILSLACFALISFVGGLLYHLVEGIGVVRSVYYVTNLGSTIGPGDYVAQTANGLLFSIIYTTVSIPIFLACSYQYSRSLVELFDLTSATTFVQKSLEVKIVILFILWMFSSIFHITYAHIRFPGNSFLRTVWSVYNIQTTIGLGWNFDEPSEWTWVDVVIAMHAHLLSVGNFVLLIDLIVMAIQKRGAKIVKHIDILTKAAFARTLHNLFIEKNLSQSDQESVVKELQSALEEISEVISRNPSFVSEKS